MTDDVDPSGAFGPGPRLKLRGANAGALSGLTFAAKDNFDVAGHVTGAGVPDWARTHQPAARTADAIESLLAAGASLVGKTQMDPLAWGSLGVNEHYGSPTNPAAPGRISGGSSSGSASAVASGAVDFALGTDSACSVRLPAALCGLYGLRPTLGRVSVAGVMPLSPSLDTVGWFARSPDHMARIGPVLLQPARKTPPIRRLLIAEDVNALAQPATLRALKPVMSKMQALFGEAVVARLVPAAGESLNMLWYRVWSVQIREVWAQHGAWIDRVKPNSKILSRERFAVGANSTPEEMHEARTHWRRWLELVRSYIGADGVLCLPTVSEYAPLYSDSESITRFAKATLNLMSLAVVSGLPQLTIPAARVDDLPIGLSLIGPPNAEEALIEFAARLTAY